MLELGGGQRARALSLVGYDADEGEGDARLHDPLLDRLAFTPQRNGKLTLLRDFMRDTPDPERGWALASLTGELTFDAAKPAFIRKAFEARMDPALFAILHVHLCWRSCGNRGAGLAGETWRQS